MVRTKKNLLAEVNSAVIPLLNPTVLKADIHSKQISRKFLSESKIAIQPIEKDITSIERSIIANALLTETSGISLLYISRRDLPFATLMMFSTAMAKVLVFIPPPVEAGEAPIHISDIKIRTVGMLKIAVSTVLNPAVLVVTAPKNAVIILPIKVWFERVLLNSKAKKASVPTTVKAKDVFKTIRVLTFINHGKLACLFLFINNNSSFAVL